MCVTSHRQHIHACIVRPFQRVNIRLQFGIYININCLSVEMFKLGQTDTYEEVAVAALHFYQISKTNEQIGMLVAIATL